MIGEVVDGHYVVRGLLGRGGMSRVYEADDTTLRRRVAIKVAEDQALGATMLLHEARAIAAVRHPGLPAVYGLGTHHGAPYLVLERLYGSTLEQRMESVGPDGHFSVAETIRILAGVADVLTAVHTAGMVHRDVKPGNIMLCAAHRVVLLDFGIMLPEVGADGAISCGTPRYLAPEVATGGLQPGRAHLIDVYAFGVMAFELLTGRPPFTSTHIGALMLDHACTPPPDVMDLRPDLSPALGTLVNACLAKNPVDRPSAIDIVLWELRTILRRLERIALGSSATIRAPR